MKQHSSSLLCKSRSECIVDWFWFSTAYPETMKMSVSCKRNAHFHKIAFFVFWSNVDDVWLILHRCWMFFDWFGVMAGHEFCTIKLLSFGKDGWPWILEAYHLTPDLKNLEQLKDAWAWFQDYFTAIRPHSRPKTSGTAERCASMISRLFHSHMSLLNTENI